MKKITRLLALLLVLVFALSACGTPGSSAEPARRARGFHRSGRAHRGPTSRRPDPHGSTLGRGALCGGA